MELCILSYTRIDFIQSTKHLKADTSSEFLICNFACKNSVMLCHPSFAQRQYSNIQFLNFDSYYLHYKTKITKTMELEGNDIDNALCVCFCNEVLKRNVDSSFVKTNVQ